MTDIFQFPFQFEVSHTQQTLQTLPAESWIAHYNKNDYEGEWDIIPLRSGWGHPTNIYSVPMPASNYQDTPWMEQFPEVQHIMNTLLCDKTSVRFMRLHCGADIKEHCDDNLDAGLNAEARLHIPIQTHNNVEFYLSGNRIQMKPGECWYLNFNKPHKVKNPGPVHRIHLVIDCVVNNWLREQMQLHVNSGE